MKLGTVFFWIVLVFLLQTEGWGEDWKAYQATKKGDIYSFDSDSIEPAKEGRIKVWVKVEKTEFDGTDLKGHVNEIQSGNKSKVTGEVIQLLEIDCPQRTFRIINLAVYSKNRDIQEYYSEPSDWEVIHPDSVTQELFRVVCP
jgi:hypothetical protein